HRDLDKFGVAVPGFTVGKCELRAFDDNMDKVRTEWIEIVEIEALKQRQLLQEHRTLAPWPALCDRVAAIVEGQRRLDRGLPARQIVAGQQPAMAPPRRIHHLLNPAETVDRVGDKTAIPGRAGALDLALTRAVAGFRQHAAVGG